VSAATQTVAVAGGTGFVGRAIALELGRRGHRVIVLSHRARPANAPANAPVAGAEVAGAEAAARPEYRRADVTRPESLAAALAGVDVLVISLHFAIRPSRRPDAARPSRRSTPRARRRWWPRPWRPACAHRLYVGRRSGGGCAQALVPGQVACGGSSSRQRHRHTIFRPSWIYGPGDHSLNRFLGFSRWLPFIPQIGNGRQLLAPVYVGDIGALVADSLTTPAAEGATLEVGGPETLTMDEIIRTALRVLGRRRVILHAPVVLMKALTAPLTSAAVATDDAHRDRLRRPVRAGGHGPAPRAVAPPAHSAGRGAGDLPRARAAEGRPRNPSESYPRSR